MKKRNNELKLIYTSIIIIIAVIISYAAIKCALKSSNVFDNHCYIEARYKKIPILMYHSISKKAAMYLLFLQEFLKSRWNQ